MFHNILEPGFDGIGFKSNEDFKIMRPQHLAPNAVVRDGEGGADLLVGLYELRCVDGEKLYKSFFKKLSFCY